VKPLKVELRESDHTALVTVPEKQLSLAIGKDGQNARLAAKLTGWRVDVTKPAEGEVYEEVQDDSQEAVTSSRRERRHEGGNNKRSGHRSRHNHDREQGDRW